MLYEIRHTRQRDDEGPCRWFADDFFDLLVWGTTAQAIAGFQLVYDKRRAPRALTWHQDLGYGHARVDDGAHRPGKPKATPLLLPDGSFDCPGLGEAFAHASARLDPALAQFVQHKIEAYPGPTAAVHVIGPGETSLRIA
jgi:hypothetical protein